MKKYILMAACALISIGMVKAAAFIEEVAKTPGRVAVETVEIVKEPIEETGRIVKGGIVKPVPGKRPAPLSPTQQRRVRRKRAALYDRAKSPILEGSRKAREAALELQRGIVRPVR